MWNQRLWIFGIAAIFSISVDDGRGSPVDITTDVSWTSPTAFTESEVEQEDNADIMETALEAIIKTFEGGKAFIQSAYKSNDVEVSPTLDQYHNLIMVWIYSLGKGGGVDSDFVALLLNSQKPAESDEELLEHYSFAKSDINNILGYFDAGKGNVRLSDNVLNTLCRILDTTTASKFNQTTFEYCLDNGYFNAVGVMINRAANLNWAKANGDTLMHVSALYGNINALRFLNEASLSIDRKNNEGLTPLYYAAMRKQDEAVEYLKSLGADVNSKDDNGDTLLSIAAIKGDLAAAESLIKAGASLEIGFEGMTPLYRAAQHGKDEMMKFLIENGADIHMIWNGCEPISWAARYNHTTALQKFIEFGVDVDTASCGKFTPLHWAARGGLKEMVQTLISLGANINALTNPGRTPMHEAAFWCHYDVVELLFKNNARVDIEDKTGNKPIHMAKMNDHFAMAAMLQSLEATGKLPLQETPLLTFNY